MGLFGGTSREATLKYDETFCRKLLCFFVHKLFQELPGPRVLTFIRATFSFRLLWFHGNEAISEAGSRCILLIFLEVKLPHAHFFPSASHFHVLFSFNSTFRFAILSFFNSAETFHFAFRHFCLHSRPSK